MYAYKKPLFWIYLGTQQLMTEKYPTNHLKMKQNWF